MLLHVIASDQWERGNPISSCSAVFTVEEMILTLWLKMQNSEYLRETGPKGRIGEVEIKSKMAKVLNDFLDPIREQRAFFASRDHIVKDILEQGTELARAEAQKTLELVKGAMGLNFLKEENDQKF